MKFENIINKYGYTEEFNKFLKEIYYELVKEFGQEEIIYEALLNTPIVSVDNVYEYLKDNNLLDESDTLVEEGDLRRSSGVFHSKPAINYNIDNTYKIVNINRVVAVVNFDLNNDSSKATLIHELCHLVKAYNNEYVIDNNMLLSRNGLVEQTYELSFDGTKVSTKLVKEIGVGLEEGLTSVSEENIAQKIVNPEYKSSGYGVVNSIAKNLLSIPNMREILVSAEMYHDKSELYNTLGSDYNSLEELADRIYKLNLIMFSQAFEPDKMELTKQELITLLNTEYKELVERMNNNLKL